MVKRSAGLRELNDHGHVELNRTDAERLGICNGDTVEVSSAHGSVTREARVLRRGGPRPGVAFMPFHFADAPANRITRDHDLDPQAKIPNLKVDPVRAARRMSQPSGAAPYNGAFERHSCCSALWFSATWEPAAWAIPEVLSPL